MMKCLYCGNELPVDSRFCIFCGKPVRQAEKKSYVSGAEGSSARPVVFCTNCGAKILPGNQYCIYCGTKAYIPDPVVEKRDVPEAEPASEIKGEKIAASSVAEPAIKEEEVVNHVTAPKAGTEEMVNPVAATEPVAEEMVMPAPDLDEPMSGEGNSDDYDPASDETVLQPFFRIVLTNLDRPGCIYTAPILDEVGIGRKWGEILVKDDPELSRIHCRVVLKGGQLFLVDENSKNGTIYKNHRIPSTEETPIHSGDIIRMGKYSYSIELKAEY